MSVPAFSVHHDPSVFRESYEFRPERWMEVEGEEKRGVTEGFALFSTGPRACIGRNLGYFE